ncbi:MAG TPA: hypothetical protein VEH76_02385 [Methylocystis sp.]|nr:hypothetical protein [Methylocystis sp.]
MSKMYKHVPIIALIVGFGCAMLTTQAFAQARWRHAPCAGRVCAPAHVYGYAAPGVVRQPVPYSGRYYNHFDWSCAETGGTCD